jgi:hypothetical protein
MILMIIVMFTTRTCAFLLALLALLSLITHPALLALVAVRTTQVHNQRPYI